ncbi:cytochrome P450 [Streptomyces sp. NPDC049837]|uniref:cytochrome P450 n=1 Tax=Streptomyces sp. NPDC049837 TaxID=3155277 RepID=UPI003434A4FE
MDRGSHGGSAPECPYAGGLIALHGPAAERDFDAVYAFMRRHRGPVVAVEIAPGVAGWLVLGHREVLEVIWNARLFSSDPYRWSALSYGLLPKDTPLLPLLGPRPAVSRLDGDEHLRHRRAVIAVLEHIDPRRLSRLVRHRADALVDAWAARGTADLMAQYARPVVWHVFAHLLGVSDGSVTTLDHLAATVVNGFPAAADAEAELLAAMRRLVAERSVAPAPDLPSWLAHATPLTDDEIAHNLLALVLTGCESTIGWIASAVRSFFAHDGPARATAPGSLVPRLVEHALGTGAPVPNITGRWATADVVLAGCRIRAGDLVIPCLAAANADPQLRDTPVSRTRAHVAWGTGAHGCPAKDTARVITESAVEVLLDRLPGLRPAAPEAALLRRPSPWSGAPAELPVVFSPDGPADTCRGAVAPPLGIMDAPDKRRDDSAAAREAAPQRWSWWNSLGGW